MQFGFMEDFRNPEPWARPFPELYNALLDQTIRAEELGYEHVWLTEHHFTADGYNPSLLPTAAAIATRTEHYSDWDVYSAAAVSASDSGGGRWTCVDIWSNGRFDLGVGQGYSYMEFDALCMPRKNVRRVCARASS